MSEPQSLSDVPSAEISAAISAALSDPQQEPEVADPQPEKEIDDETVKVLPSSAPDENVDKQKQEEDNDATQSGTVESLESEELEELEEKNDPYYYTNQNLFTSEIFKIEIRKLPKFFGLGEIKKLLNILKLDATKVKPASRSNCRSVFVGFTCEAHKQRALSALNGYIWKGSTLEAIVAKPAKDPLMLKRKNDAEQTTKQKVAKVDIEEMTIKCTEKLKDSTTPYWRQSYDEQLDVKYKEIKEIMKTYANRLFTQNHKPMKVWIDQQFAKHDGLICPLEPFRSSKVTTGYRNRCEFTIGHHAVTGERAVGFRLRSYAEGDCSVFPPNDSLHISDIAKKCAKIFEAFVASSELEPYDPVARSGHFKCLGVRNTSLDQLMINLDICTTGLSEEQLAKFREDYKEFFVTGAGKELEVDSLYLKEVTVQTKKGDAYRPSSLIYGKPIIVEKLLGYEFEISPQSFFQINTPSAEILYSTIAELAAPNEKMTVLDICCGTGTIGITMAKHAGQILGVEIVKAAVENAKTNAVRNSVQDKCDFFTGCANDSLQPIVVRAKHDNIVAIIDPPRPGVGKNVLNTIRATWKIKTLVFVACNFEASYQNLVHLGKHPSKVTPGDPFVPVRVIPIDMFPFAKQYEVVILLERISLDTLRDLLPAADIALEEENGKKTHAANIPPAHGGKKAGDNADKSKLKQEETQDEIEVVCDMAKDILHAEYAETASRMTRKGRKRYLFSLKKKGLINEQEERRLLQIEQPPAPVPAEPPLPKLKKQKLRKNRGLKDRQLSNFGQPGPSFGSQGQHQPSFGHQGQQRSNFGHQGRQGTNFGNQGQQRPNFGRPFQQGIDFGQPQAALQFMGQNTHPLLNNPQIPMHFQEFQQPQNPQFTMQPFMNMQPQPQAPRPPSLRQVATQTDCKEFMSREEFDEAENLGFTWGSRIADGVLHDFKAMQREEEEAVQRFKEGFLTALRIKQKKLLAEIQRPSRSTEIWEGSRAHSSYVERSRSPPDVYSRRRNSPPRGVTPPRLYSEQTESLPRAISQTTVSSYSNRARQEPEKEVSSYKPQGNSYFSSLRRPAALDVYNDQLREQWPKSLPTQTASSASIPTNDYLDEGYKINAYKAPSAASSAPGPSAPLRAPPAPQLGPKTMQGAPYQNYSQYQNMGNVEYPRWKISTQPGPSNAEAGRSMHSGQSQWARRN
ncbi:uncharacterized protein LOC132201523 [Neocloeon triangulifer]|uniref:uncharacterized protein LOC132201523 n=1 Tax=Neocloeon triangulifer TaxID=2078957 RepID=UPI00286F5696|nr:uncharacterized protein LOC132201523 [Neocloeon triangulifer]XP_059483716.1 uncharacterized protein LOC132201523 [Neocloeon triangulifer]XP_059483717.1 uncharacterized protein LOC132201523 [Neocloeon triangulifer]